MSAPARAWTATVPRAGTAPRSSSGHAARTPPRMNSGYSAGATRCLMTRTRRCTTGATAPAWPTTPRTSPTAGRSSSGRAAAATAGCSGPDREERNNTADGPAVAPDSTAVRVALWRRCTYRSTRHRGHLAPDRRAGPRHVPGTLLAERYFANRTDGLRPSSRRGSAGGHHLRNSGRDRYRGIGLRGGGAGPAPAALEPGPVRPAHAAGPPEALEHADQPG